jgi:hypothetical protein
MALFPLLAGRPMPAGAFADEKPRALEALKRVPGPVIGPQRLPGGFGGRPTAQSREQLVKEGGGNAGSEAAVALGLKWLALHQADDGHWSLDEFHECARNKLTHQERFTCDCVGKGIHNDPAATALGLLPFLGAGITQQSDGEFPVDYSRTVAAGLKWLLKEQDKVGTFGGGMYGHGLATIALCEAYALSNDKTLKEPAQQAIDYIVAAQDPAGGGWRYTPRSGSDTSVTGWQVMALKSGQMAGLRVPQKTLDGAAKWLNSVQTADGGGYGYLGPLETPTLSAVGLLCREYLGWGPSHPGLLKGISRQQQYIPGSPNEVKSIYFQYYATQVMHHVGGEAWAKWNPKMRDSLVNSLDRGQDRTHPHKAGSWDPRDDVHVARGGRLMQTALSLLILEVYYRHLPLEGGQRKPRNSP